MIKNFALPVKLASQVGDMSSMKIHRPTNFSKGSYELCLLVFIARLKWGLIPISLALG